MNKNTAINCAKMSTFFVAMCAIMQAASVFAADKISPRAEHIKAMSAFGNAIAANKEADANLIKARGQLLENVANSRKTHADAENAELDNRYKRVTQRFQLKEINEKYRASHRRQPPSAEVLAKFSRQRIPARIVLPQVGSNLSWPYIMCNHRFEEHCRRIERLISQRSATNSGIGSKNCHELLATIRKMKQILKLRIREVSTEEYVTARKFLDGLAYEVRFVSNTTSDKVAVQ